MAGSADGRQPSIAGTPYSNDADDKETLQVGFSPEEEAELVAESNAHKATANNLFSAAKYRDAIDKYNDAVSACPRYLDYELSVLKSNIAACFLKLEEWKEAASRATEALDGLDKLRADEQNQDAASENRLARQAGTAGKERGERGPETTAVKEEDEEDIEEIVSLGATKAAPAPQKVTDEEAAKQKRKDDIVRIRAKALMRRARARSELGGWSNLAGAEEDYRELQKMAILGLADRRTVQSQLQTLPARSKAAQEKEMSEMWGKLKDLGNGILKPFGLSTDNFQMAKDENTGGYSMNFNQGPANR